MSRSGNRALAAALRTVRALWGITLLAVPDRAARWFAGGPTPPGMHLPTVVRALGARHLVQSGVETRLVALPGFPGRVGRSVDLVHAGTALALGALYRRWRRAAWTDAGLAACFGVASHLVRGR